MVDDRSVGAQVDAALGVLRHALGPTEIIGAYLYGSAVQGGLRPDSDLDLFVVTDRSLDAAEKARIVEGLLPFSGRDTRPPTWRPLEVTVVAQPEVRPWRYPARVQLQYGEWLRAAFLAGDVEPEPAEKPDLGVMIAMVRERGRALVGPPATEVLDPVPHADLVRAMLDGVPPLLEDLEDDTRNVLLTLARIWTTVATGEIRSKDAAADWALAQLPEDLRPMLARARDLYREGGYGEWPDAGAVRELAEIIVGEIQRGART
jgi:predicted nucleotidyltransferase